MNITGRLMSAEDGAALVAHPDVVLVEGEPWVCSCGMSAVTMWAVTYRINGEEHREPAHTWCVHCGETVRWEPRTVESTKDVPAHIDQGPAC